MRSLKFLGVMALMMSFAGCISVPHTSPQSNASPPETAKLQHWQASGRIAVAGATGGGSGSFTWVQDGGDAKVQMRGPIGIGSLRLTISAGNTHIATGDGQSFDAADAEAELASRLGATVPIQNLRYWLTGVAAPGVHEWSNEAATLTQESWRIDYLRYAIVDDVKLPTKLLAVSDAAKVRIMVDRWRLQ